MPSHILKTAAKHLIWPFILMSLFILWRGHNEPGGGFIGGLVAASAFILYTVGHDVTAAKRLLRVDTRMLIGAGLALALTSVASPLLARKPLMTAWWFDLWIPGVGEQSFGSPLLFDTGVYLVVVGVLLTLVFAMAEDSP